MYQIEEKTDTLSKCSYITYQLWRSAGLQPNIASWILHLMKQLYTAH